MSSPPVGQRGPAEHERREQIIAAAGKHFRHYGYDKTTIADLARSIGLSTAYIYKFFESKRSIGEAACGLCLGEIASAVTAIAAERRPASGRLRRVILELAHRGSELFFKDRKMHDIVVAALTEKWHCNASHDATLLAVLRSIVQQGRDAGEFERKTPLEETCQSILLILEPIKNPMLLAQRLETLDADAAAIAGLVLRSLAN